MSENELSPYTSFLFARPTFWEGMGRALDLGGTMTDYNRSPSGEEADDLALRADFIAVAEDLQSGVHQFSQEMMEHSDHG